MEWFLIFQSISEKSITVTHINQEANKRKAEAKVKSSKPKKRTVETSVSSDFDANIDEKDLVQSDPEIDEDSDVETPMIQKAFSSI